MNYITGPSIPHAPIHFPFTVLYSLNIWLATAFRRIILDLWLHSVNGLSRVCSIYPAPRPDPPCASLHARTPLAPSTRLAIHHFVLSAFSRSPKQSA